MRGDHAPLPPFHRQLRVAGSARHHRRGGHRHSPDADGRGGPDRDRPLPGRHRPSPHGAAGHARLHRGLRQLGELQLHHPIRTVHRLRSGGRLRPCAVLAGHRIAFDGLRRIGGSRTGQSQRLPPRRGLHRDRPAVHLVGLQGGRRFVLHGVQLLPERDGRQHREEQPDRASPLGHSQFRLRLQPEQAQRRHPRALRRCAHSGARRDVQRCDGDELTAAGTLDHRRRGTSIRPGRRLPHQSAQRALPGEHPARLRLRASRRPLRSAGSARAVPGFDLLPDPHRHPADPAAPDDRSVSRATTGHHIGSATASPGRNRLQQNHQSRRTHAGQVPLHPQPTQGGGRRCDRDTERVGQRNRLCHR